MMLPDSSPLSTPKIGSNDNDWIISENTIVNRPNESKPSTIVVNPGSIKVTTDEDQESNEMYLLQYFPLNRSDSKDEVVEYSALMKSIEGSLAQPVSLRQRSPMQKKHRSYLSTSEPSSSPDKLSDDHHNLLPDSAEIESIVHTSY